MNKRITAIIAVLGLLIIGGFFAFKMLFTDAADKQPQNNLQTSLSNRGQDLSTTLIQQGRTYKRAFERILGVGFDAYNITHGQQDSNDLIQGRHRTTKRQDVPDDVLADKGTGWALGGGQIIGPFQAEAADIVMYVNGLNKRACQQINNVLWGDSLRDEPSLTGSSVADWQQKQVNILQIFSGKSRPHGCVSVGGNYLFYYLVYQSKT